MTTRRAHLRTASDGPTSQPSGGFSLVELLVALVILEVGLLAVAGLVFIAQENLARAELLTRGTLAAARVADSLGGGLAVEGGESVRPWGEVRWDAGSGGLRVLALSAGGDTVGEALVWSPPPDSLFWWPDGLAPAGGGGP